MPFEKGHPGYPPRASFFTKRGQARNLAMVCKEAVSDEEMVEWLLTIASGRWPRIRPKRDKNGEEIANVLETPPSEAIRFAALKEFGVRRDGLPMQAIVLEAQVHMRARMLEAADDVIDVEAIDVTAARVLEGALLGAIKESNGEPEASGEE